ncbi:hypothetical protein SBDP2_770019 [Syntrophobacter sp. SbD2]|nr:hypothetical protein SBDP2_770019 [Syntrophobacter sp. SbD2]
MSILLTSRAERYGDRTGIIAPEGSFTYRQLLDASGKVASFLLDGSKDLQQRPVAFLAPPGFHYVALQWGIWRAGGIAVPLSVFHPRPELEYVLDDTTPAAVVAHPDFVSRIDSVAGKRNLRFALSTEALDSVAGPLPSVVESRRAMILYTSGTTGKPKGVVSTHENIAAQITSLVEAWGWTVEDRILEVLPLHHIHGIVNVIACALWVGAVCEIFPAFDAQKVWDRIAQGGHLCKADRRLGEGICCRTGTHVPGLPPDAAYGVRFSGLAGPDLREVEGDFRTCPVGAIRNDRDRYVPFQPAAGEAVSRMGRDPIAGGGSEVN